MIPKPFRKRSEKKGLPPGTLVHYVREKPRRYESQSSTMMNLVKVFQIVFCHNYL